MRSFDDKGVLMISCEAACAIVAPMREAGILLALSTGTRTEACPLDNEVGDMENAGLSL